MKRIRKPRQEVPQGVDPEFVEVLNEGLQEYEDVFETLKDR